MSICVFFGHRDCPHTIAPKLRAAIIDLIVNAGVDNFYVGNQGQFDALVRGILRDLVQEFPHIRYAVVLASLSAKNLGDTTDTLLPDGIERIHPRYAIDWRNQWMLRQADYVIAYVTHEWGGAAKFVQKAIAQKKRVVLL